MPQVTHPAIVSSSNYTSGAINKALTHKVALYVMKPWTEPIALQFPNFPNIGKPEDFLGVVQSTLLYWIDTRFNLFIPSAEQAKIDLDSKVHIFDARGKVHKQFENLESLQNDLLMRSTDILFSLDPAQMILRTFPPHLISSIGEFDVGPAWPHTHTIQVTHDNVFLMLDGTLHRIHSITINGHLQWRSKKRTPQFYIMEGVPDAKVFAGATVADFGSDDGKMFAFIMTPESRDMGVHLFQLSEKTPAYYQGVENTCRIGQIIHHPLCPNRRARRGRIQFRRGQRVAASPDRFAKSTRLATRSFRAPSGDRLRF